MAKVLRDEMQKTKATTIRIHAMWRYNSNAPLHNGIYSTFHPTPRNFSGEKTSERERERG